MNLRRVSLVFILAVFFLPGCTTLHSMESPPVKGGVVQVYDVPLEKAMELGLHACQVSDLDIEANNKEQRYIVASDGISAWSWGERIGIYFKSLNDKQTEIRVVSKAKIKTNFFAP